MSENKYDPKKHIMNMRGKEYLEVKWRIVWFRTDNPTGAITTHIVSTDPLMVRASITIGGNEVATGHGSAEKKQGAVWSGRELEKAETAAIGRALAHAGYGTQFTGEDESDNLVDSPVEKKQVKSTPKPEPTTEHRELVKQFSASFNAIPAEMKGNAVTINGNSTDDEIRKAIEHNKGLGAK